jgi:hypothetical protein
MLLCVRKADFTVADTHHHPHVPIKLSGGILKGWTNE